MISIITINFPTTCDLNTTESTRSRIMTQSKFPFCVRDVSFPKCNTRYI